MSIDSSPPPPPSPSATRSVWLNAVYLGVSWTWCIGMFLSVLLIRDFGLWSFVVFAVPNVVGAAAMGWLISRQTSERIVREHAAACRWFSGVTILFQFFFLAWYGNTGGPIILLVMAAGFGGVLLAGTAAGARHAPLAGVIWIVSAALGIAMLAMGVLHPSSDPSLTLPHQIPAVELLALAPVCMVGFLLCPYLDLTFHAVRRTTDERGSRRAFTLGFGVFFFAMILLTLAYSHWVAANRSLWPHTAAMPIAVLLAIHLSIQLAFTIVAHARQLLASGSRVSLLVGVLLFFFIAFALTIGDHAWPILRSDPLSPGERVYRLFMAFYGLVFPAYVYLCLIPPRGSPIAAPSRRTLYTCLFTIGLAAPFYWMGFIERQTWLLLPGVAIVLLARLAIRRDPLVVSPTS